MANLLDNSLILVDAFSYLYRAYYACPRLSTSSGFPTGAIYGMLNMLRALIFKYQPTHIAIVFDVKGKTFRDDIFTKYKSHRPLMPDDLCIQLKPLKKIIKAMGLPILAISGVEADDVIGTLALEAEKSGHTVLISTSDKDMAQLVTHKIHLINTMNHTVFGPEEIIKKYGVPPILIIDLFALMGDASDNIPGVPGIGCKTAIALLQKFNGIKAIYENLEIISSLTIYNSKNIIKKLKKYKAEAFLSYQLATIKTDVTLNITSNHLILKDPNIDVLRSLFKNFELNKWAAYLDDKKLWRSHKRVNSKQSKEIILKNPIIKSEIYNPEVLNTYFTILDQITLSLWLNKLRHSKCFSLNLETSSVDALTTSIIGFSFSMTPGEAAYLPILHDYPNAPTQLAYQDVLLALKPLLENTKIAKIGKNLKFDRGVLQRHNIELKGMCFDTKLESYALNSINNGHDIYTLAQRWLGYDLTLLAEITKEGKNQLTFSKLSLATATHYAASLADITLQLHYKMWKELEKEQGPKRIFEQIEMPLIPVLSRIEQHGVLINQHLLSKCSQEIGDRLIKLELKAHKLAGESFNLASPKQLKNILFYKNGFKSLKKTANGNLSTSEEVLSKLAIEHPLPKVILEYRSLSKIKSAYTDKLPLMIHPETRRVHTSYHQAVTVTGRLSSSNPNLQSIPARSSEGRRIRQAFTAAQGKCLIAADYSQIELRIMAHFSQDIGLLSAFSKEQDIHCATASEVFGIAFSKVSKEQRQRAKTINFGLIYGMSPFGLARQLHISVKEAKIYVDCYFDRYPGVFQYMKNTRQQALENGYVSTLYGRRLYLPNIQDKNIMRRKAAERAAINAPMQGTAADIIKRTMINIDKWLLQQKHPAFKMIMQVHDELVFEAQIDTVKEASIKICSIMENSENLDVPLRVDIGVGKNWDQAH
ncbi:DNA polymerase I [Candidatus Erwinia haradaeae]|uniref:DNA polymerase I n=1 Tax=Candidatus Erwinia haradaeae TaxID=1922217 RepID=A0A451DJQ8_9GAMM|nr:DNA polymerase I [Candidatus Erwinia haradaeae]VFP86932.1 DNA polymerase I [Candidatus Erwinia haradaeae]